MDKSLEHIIKNYKKKRKKNLRLFKKKENGLICKIETRERKTRRKKRRKKIIIINLRGAGQDGEIKKKKNQGEEEEETRGNMMTRTYHRTRLPTAIREQPVTRNINNSRTAAKKKYLKKRGKQSPR